ncbi:YdcF family protein [Chryseosolibacter indicus]|uniref:YdcF family protein n=1 Tax=Chryseosolibacter indicus TaxID=2782351 RepID=A0ABS5VTE9_9BACT|nr:YdcF family protein [Chryseosolibacter indicus]MBT1704698.1 YdcF family protein [Chryseosolibacter indicus]
MFFVLSKVLGYLIQPFTIVCVLFIVSVLIKNTKWRKRTFWTAFVMLLFFSNDFIANEAMRAWEVKAKPFKEMRKYKLAIVLTGSTQGDLYPSDRVYFSKGADRVVHTVQLYKLGLVEKILISGGSGRLVTEDEPEANKFRSAMILMGVPEEVILIENETRNTAESAIEVQKLLKQMNYKSEDCLLVTSAFHMRRSIACYRKVGLNIETFSTDFYTHQRNFYPDTLFIPKLEAFSLWQRLIKEWVGIVAYKFAGYI